MKSYYLCSALLLVGCAHSSPPVTIAEPEPLPQRHDLRETASVRTPEQLKAYPAGRYEDPDDASVMHESHTVYRTETSPEWNTAPNATTYVPLGPTVAVADPSQQHTALTAELEQRLKQEDQLLQTTYEQNERLAEEIKSLEEQVPHVRLFVPNSPPPSPASAPEPKPKSQPSSQSSPVTATSQQKSWWSWLWPNSNKSNPTTK